MDDLEHFPRDGPPLPLVHRRRKCRNFWLDHSLFHPLPVRYNEIHSLLLRRKQRQRKTQIKALTSQQGRSSIILVLLAASDFQTSNPKSASLSHHTLSSTHFPWSTLSSTISHARSNYPSPSSASPSPTLLPFLPFRNRSRQLHRQPTLPSPSSPRRFLPEIFLLCPSCSFSRFISH